VELRWAAAAEGGAAGIGEEGRQLVERKVLVLGFQGRWRSDGRAVNGARRGAGGSAAMGDVGRRGLEWRRGGRRLGERLAGEDGSGKGKRRPGLGRAAWWQQKLGRMGRGRSLGEKESLGVGME